jgi:hypothetical protein
VFADCHATRTFVYKQLVRFNNTVSHGSQAWSRMCHCMAYHVWSVFSHVSQQIPAVPLHSGPLQNAGPQPLRIRLSRSNTLTLTAGTSHLQTPYPLPEWTSTMNRMQTESTRIPELERNGPDHPDGCVVEDHVTQYHTKNYCGFELLETSLWLFVSA